MYIQEDDTVAEVKEINMLESPVTKVKRVLAVVWSGQMGASKQGRFSALVRK